MILFPIRGKYKRELERFVESLYFIATTNKENPTQDRLLATANRANPIENKLSVAANRLNRITNSRLATANGLNPFSGMVSNHSNPIKCSAQISLYYFLNIDISTSLCFVTHDKDLQNIVNEVWIKNKFRYIDN